MQGFDRNVMLDGSVYGHHEVASVEFYVGSYLALQVRSWRDAAAKESAPTEFHTTRLLDYDATDTVTIDAACERVMTDERFAEYVDPAQSALDELLPTLTDEQAELVPQIYPEWAVGVSYKVGDRVRYDGKLYRCVQAHDSQEGWEPPSVPALWVRTAPEGEIPEWVQPTGAQDAYNKGDRVRYEGKVYESTIDGNVWSPTDYPQGWTEVAE